MAVIFGATGDGAERLRFAVDDSANVVESVAALDEQLNDSPDEMLVVVDPEVDLTVVTALAERYRVLRPALGIILTRRRVDLSVVNQAMRAGIREVVPIDDAGALVTACRRSLELSEKMRGLSAGSASGPVGKVILVFSAKGGCGKTTVSTNLADAISASGAGRVCLVDFDLQFGDVGIALRVNPVKTLKDLVDMSAHLDKQALTSLAISVRPGFDVLLAPSNPVDAEFITGEMCGNVLHLLQGLYDYIVVDSSPAFTDVVLESFDSADVHVLLTTLDIPTIKNMRVALSTMDELDLPRSKRVLVVNHSDLATGVGVDDVERSLGMPVSVRIPSSEAVPNSINRGVTLVQSDPKHAVSRAIEDLAGMVTGHERTVSAPAKRSIFSRRKQEAGL